MNKNIVSKIDCFINDERLTPETRDQAIMLKNYINNNRPIPDSLKKLILRNNSNSQTVIIMKNYVENKIA